MGDASDERGFLLGDEVYVASKFRGTVRFIGETQFAPGIWVGIELAEPQGRNDGVVRNVRYFSCPPEHGIFVRELVIKPAAQVEARRLSKGLEPLPTNLVQSVANIPIAPDGQDSDSDDGTDCIDTVALAAIPAGRSSRRYGVSAETARQAAAQSEAVWQPPVYEKSEQEREQLAEIIRTSHDSKMHMFFDGIPSGTLEKVIDAMFQKQVAQGEHIIEQGDEGQFFYIVKNGTFEVLKQTKPQEPVKVFEFGAGFAFGELALLYNAPRSATVIATVVSEVWCLERTAFRELVVRSFEQQFKQYIEFLRNCHIFSELNQDQIASLAEVLQEEDFEEDEAILEQGEKDNKMYMLRKGKAVACIQGDQGEVEVMHYNQGDYFGEIALLTGEPRKASVYAVGPVNCIYITRETFARLLGPLRDFLQKNIQNYQQYQDALVAEDARKASFQVEDYAANPASPDSGEKPRERRKRSRDVKEIGQVLSQGVTLKGHENVKLDGEPTSLAEKVAQDFTNAALVEPCAEVALSKSDLQVCGGLRPGEKFTVDKTLLVMSKAHRASDGLDDVYTWMGPAWLKGSTHAAVICQKGQKSASDPTPNQDNFFIVHSGSIGIFGVCDGHGPFGHLVSFRLVQTLPYFISSNIHFGKDWALALKEAFLSAQSDLVNLCSAQEVNIEASGAAGTVVVFDGTGLHLAHIGDAGAMVASYNRRDSRLIHGTRDHKPNLPEEQARLEAAGSEVREVDQGNWRIFLKGSAFPGLTMSRAFGDIACDGVLREPEYTKIFVQPSDEVYLVLASDGIWEFITYENAVELSAKKLRLKGPKETVNFLTSASRKRWAHVCGDYCDDITCMLVQWNVNEKSSDSTQTNHSLSLRRHQ